MTATLNAAPPAGTGQAIQTPLFNVATPKKRKRTTKKTRPAVDPIGVSYTHDGARTTLTFPAPDRLLSINTVKHWRVTGPVKRAWREAMYWHAVAAKLPKGMARIRVDVELRFPTGGRRDAPNYHPYVAKPIVDALGPGRVYTVKKGSRAGQTVTEAGYGLIPDDTAAYLDGPFPRIGPTAGRPPDAPYGVVVVTITDLSTVDGDA